MLLLFNKILYVTKSNPSKAMVKEIVLPQESSLFLNYFYSSEQGHYTEIALKACNDLLNRTVLLKK